MIGDSPADDARGMYPGADMQARVSSGAAAGQMYRPRAPLPQPGHEFVSASWLITVLRHVRFGS